jgi:hypothetical protein
MFVTNQTIGMHLPIGLLTRLGQRFEKILPIHVILVNVLAPISSTHHVMNRSRIINSQLTGHAPISPTCPSICKAEKRTKLWPGRKTNFRKIVKSVFFYGFSIYVCI